MGKIQVIVVGVCGKRSTIDVCDTAEQLKNVTVTELKKIIETKIPNCPGVFRLTFSNQDLEDGSSLSRYGVQHLSLILMTLILPGGCEDAP